MSYASPLFSVAGHLPDPPFRKKDHVYLIADGWDDWAKYQTVFWLFVVDGEGNATRVRSTKVGEVGLKPHQASEDLEPGFRVPSVPQEFDRLPEDFFSLGQTQNYYDALNDLEGNLGTRILVGLRDCAFDLGIFEKNLSEEVMHESLLRNVQERNVRNRLHHFAHGNAKLTRFEFSYSFPSNSGCERPPRMEFRVIPHVDPPTNVHVLIGRNGVGKTHCVQNLIRSVLAGGELPNADDGYIERLGHNADEWDFAGVVSVSFSAFDEFDVPNIDGPSRIKAFHVGLLDREESQKDKLPKIRISEKLAEDFVESLSACRSGPRSRRWLQALETLGTDPLFQVADVGSLLKSENLDDDSWARVAKSRFDRLSSGHAVVLLTITRLVELIDERTLVILDEPEGHLHPPLLSAFIRALSNLLNQRNGVAIVATHSPVVLQEVPRACVWKLRRSGHQTVSERPRIETFGENVGTLTSEVFGLEVTTAGFHSLIQTAVRDGLSYEEIVEERFGRQLGSEARAIARGLVAIRDGEAG